VEAGNNGAISLREVEVTVKAERRRFTAEYKQRVLREADDCRQSGEIGALLRREGLYWSCRVPPDSEHWISESCLANNGLGSRAQEAERWREVGYELLMR
jgi:hypothetical protein